MWWAKVASPGHRIHTSEKYCDWKLSLQHSVPDALTSCHTGNPVLWKGPQALRHCALLGMCGSSPAGIIPASQLPEKWAHKLRAIRLSSSLSAGVYLQTYIGSSKERAFWQLKTAKILVSCVPGDWGQGPALPEAQLAFRMAQTAYQALTGCCIGHHSHTTPSATIYNNFQASFWRAAISSYASYLRLQSTYPCYLAS